MKIQVVGHEQTLTRLTAAVDAGKLGSTLLFVGPAGIGKKLSALALAQKLVCENTTACGTCGACVRMYRQQSESLLLIQPEKNQIKIEQSHQVLDFLSLVHLGKARVVVIDQAETLNPQAANSLLKVLEEPPPQTYFILVAPSIRHVLPTIRSRAQVVPFAPVSIQEMKTKVQAPDWLLQASQGSFARLAELQQGDALEVREEALQFLQIWLADRAQNSLDNFLNDKWRSAIRDRSQALEISRHLMLFFRDAVILKTGGGYLLNPDQRKTIEELSKLSDETLLSVAAQLLGLQRDILANRDVQLIYEEFWLKSRENYAVAY